MSNIQRDLKAIVGIDKLEARVKALEERRPIPENRGVAYQDSLGGIQALKTSALSGALAPDTALGSSLSALTDAATDAAEEAIKDKTKPVINKPVIISIGDGIKSIKDLLDGNVEIGDVLKGISDGLIDGIPYTVREDPHYLPNISDASGHFTQGVRWTGSFAVTSTGPTAVEAAYNAATSAVGTYKLTNMTPNPTGAPLPVVDPDRYTATYIYSVDQATYTGQVTASACSVGVDQSCPISHNDVTFESLPFNVYKQENGTFAVDPANASGGSMTFTAPVEGQYGPVVLTGTTDDARFWKRVPTKGGGFMYGETSGINGVLSKYKADKQVYVYDSNGVLRYAPMGSEAQGYVGLDLSNL